MRCYPLLASSVCSALHGHALQNKMPSNGFAFGCSSYAEQFKRAPGLLMPCSMGKQGKKSFAASWQVGCCSCPAAFGKWLGAVTCHTGRHSYQGFAEVWDAAVAKVRCKSLCVCAVHCACSEEGSTQAAYMAYVVHRARASQHTQETLLQGSLGSSLDFPVSLGPPRHHL